MYSSSISHYYSWLLETLSIFISTNADLCIYFKPPDLLCPMTSHKELEFDKTLSGFMFRISPPIDDDLLETEGPVITLIPLSF